VQNPTGPLASDPDNRDRGELARVIVVNKLPAGEIARAFLVVLGLVVATYVLWSVHEAVFLLFLAILLATAIEPIVNLLRRGPFTRGSGVLVVYTVIVIVLGLLAAFLAPTLAAQGSAAIERLPQQLTALEAYAEDLRPRPLRDAAVAAIGEVRASVQHPTTPPGGNLLALGATAAHTLLSFFTVFVLAFYWLVERASIKRALLRMVPAHRAKDVNTVWLEVEQKLGGWVRGLLLLMLAMGVMASIGFFFIGLPNPFLLGVIAAFAEVIPLVGPFLAFAPAVLVALTIDPYMALLVVAFAVVAQQFEGNVLVPRVMGHTVGVSPLTVMLGILIGAILYGIPGAALAVPVAGAIQVILAHTLRMEDPAQSEAHSPPVARENAAQAPSAREAAREAGAAQAPTA
jgi:predicted PurR-regulated permease PerM